MTEDKQPDNENENINTGGGSYVGNSVTTDGGDFVGRDKVINQVGRPLRDEQYEIVLNWNGKMRLRGLDLAKRDLSGIKFTSADLSKTNLRGANLEEADLCGADLSGANLEEANLNKARYSQGTIWPHGFKYQNSGAFGPQANLRGANLRGADLSGLDLSGANLEGADLTGANLFQTDLSHANLKGASLQDAFLFNTLLGEVSFEEVYLDTAIYNESTLLSATDKLLLENMANLAIRAIQNEGRPSKSLSEKLRDMDEGQRTKRHRSSPSSFVLRLSSEMGSTFQTASKRYPRRSKSKK